MIFKNWINTVFGSTGALTGSDIPYDGADSLTDKIDAVEIVANQHSVKASQVEVDAGTDDTKFVTPLTLETKPLATDPYGVKAYVRFSGANPAVILDSVGVDSVTFVSTGVYDIVFTSGVFNTTDYVHTSGGALSINAPDHLFESLGVARTTTTMRVRSLNNNGDLNNAEEGILVFFGGQ